MSVQVPEAQPARRQEAWLLGALVAVGVALRIPELFTGIYNDEGATYFDIVPKTLGASLQQIAFTELNPPGYFLFMRVWAHAFGTSEFALKFPSFVFGVALIVVTYVVARTIAGRTAALVAASFAAISTTGIMLSGSARPYTLAALLAGCTAIAFLQIFYGRRAYAAAAAFALCGAALAWVHYTGLIFIAGLAASAPYLIWRDQLVRRIPPLIVGVLAIALAFAPCLPLLAPRLSGPAWAPSIWFGDYFGRAIEQLGFLVPLDVMHVQIAFLAALGCAISLVVIALRVARGDRASLPSGPLAAAAICVAVGVLVETPLFLHTLWYVFVFSPLALALLAAGCVWVARTATSAATPMAYRVALLLVALYIVIPAVPAQAARYAWFYTHLERSGMRALVKDAVRVAGGTRTLYVAAPDFFAAPFAYYTRTQPDIALVGFAHWDSPQLYCTLHYERAWRAPDAVAATERRIAQLVPSRFDRIALIMDAKAADLGSVPYSRVWDLRKGLERRYRTIYTGAYDGYNEPVLLVMLAPESSAQRGVSPVRSPDDRHGQAALNEPEASECPAP